MECCRVCLNENDLESIDTQIEFQNYKKTALELIQILGSIEIVSEISLPQKVCRECLGEIKSAYNLRQKIIDTDFYLKTIEVDYFNDEADDNSFETSAATSSKDTEQIDINSEIVVTVTKSSNNCDICSIKFQNIQEFQNHIREHERFPFICKDCRPPRLFSKKDNLDLHRQNFHSNNSPLAIREKKFACTTCHREYKTKNELERHANKMVMGMCVQKKSKKNKTCYLCMIELDTNQEKSSHLMEFHSSDPKYCEKCDYNAKTVVAYERHKKNHVLGFDFFCTDCNRDFPSRAALVLHEKSFHLQLEMTCICDLCGKSLKHKRHLNRHLEMVHFDIKKFKCKLCKDPFKNEVLLNKHMHLIHNIEPKLKCPDCNKGFTYESQLLGHLVQKQHGLNSSYREKIQNYSECTICNKSMDTKTRLKRHMNSHIKPFTCGDCGKSGNS